MENWSRLLLCLALISGFTWLYFSRLVVKLRSEYTRLHPITNEPIDWTPGTDLPPDLARQTVIRLGDQGETVYYLGTLVRRWDQLSPERQRVLDLYRTVSGIGTIVAAVLGLLVAALF